MQQKTNVWIQKCHRQDESLTSQNDWQDESLTGQVRDQAEAATK